MAAGSGETNVVKLLLTDDHIEADAVGWQGRTPLYGAISGHFVGVVELLATDSRVNAKHIDKDNITPFALAASEGDEEIVAILLKIPGIDVDRPSKDGRTPLARAAQFGHSAVIKQLKRSGKLNKEHSHKDTTGRNAYSLAALGGHDEVIKLLLRYGLPGIDEEDEHRWRPLFWALEAPTSSTVGTLINSGQVNVNHQDHSGRTALS